MRLRYTALAILGIALAGQGQAQQMSAPRLSQQASPPVPTLSGGIGLGTPRGRDPFRGSVPGGPATSEELSLTLQDAIQRGLKTNLGLLLSEQGKRAAEGNRWRALSGLLPNVTAHTGMTTQQVNLAAFGFSGFPGVSRVVGPFSLVDVRASLSQPVLDFSAIRRLGTASATQDAAGFSYQDARDIVVTSVANLYFQARAASARVEAAQSQVRTAQALYNQALDFKNAGVVPAIEVLRAQVELQAQQQRLIFFQNEEEKQKLDLARAIGLPIGQPFRLTEDLSEAPVPEIGLQVALARAYGSRADYQSSLAQVRAAESNQKSAVAERYPTLSLDVDYGDIGRTFGHSHGTFTAAASLRIPLFQGGRVRGEILEADSIFQQRKAELEDLRSSIEYEVRVAFMDLRATQDQVAVAKTARDLARQQMAQAQDRFAAGVTSNIEVVQAQEALATADENYITALHSFNIAKASLARSLGVAEESLQQFLRGETK